MLYEVITSSFAQLQAGFQLGPQFPMGNMSDYNTGFGLIATAKYFVNDDAAFGLNVGFNRFGTGYDDINGSFIPITALFVITSYSIHYTKLYEKQKGTLVVLPTVPMPVFV